MNSKLPVEIVHDLPGQEWRRVPRAEGYSHVIVNGEITWEGARFIGGDAG
jgi:N-acyl-D-amino-acid deacylase